MISQAEILVHKTIFDASNAVPYHTGAFPPGDIDLARLIAPQTDAAIALTRYDTMLQALPNGELLLAPLRTRDAVVSSRMEGTISTLEDVLRLEADAEDAGPSPDARDDTLEVALYARALRQSERQLSDGYPITEQLIRDAHATLLGFGRGAAKHPGDYKREQNYIGDRRHRRIDFIPVSPEQLGPGMEQLIAYVRAPSDLPLIRTAIAHAEFEALHPFEDGNGRLGRMLITLMLWQGGVLRAPHFFVSDYFERNKDEYVDRLRAVSADGDWTGWCAFFLRALAEQAATNIEVVGQIRAHHAEMRDRFRDLLRSRWSTDALTWIFANPIFRNNRFKKNAGIPPATANNITNRLVEAGLLDTLIPASGRAPALYAFPSLIDIIRD